MKRAELLLKAKEITEGARQEHYGSPEDNFANIAEYWDSYLNMRPDTPLQPADVAIMMVLMKCARLASDPSHDDSWLDIAGYAACGSEIMN